MKKLRAFLQRYFIQTDTFLALVISVLSWWLLQNYFQTLSDDFFLALIGASVSLLGFLIATISIIFAFKDGPKLDQLQKSGRYYQVIHIYLSAIFWVSLFALLFIGHISLTFSPTLQQLALTSFVVFSVIKIWRCVWIVKQMFYLSIPKNNHAH
ncbi:MAG: hypothetical protein AABZ06_07450 [Bdellovibrionota bacterium]